MDRILWYLGWCQLLWEGPVLPVLWPTMEEARVALAAARARAERAKSAPRDVRAAVPPKPGRMNNWDNRGADSET